MNGLENDRIRRMQAQINRLRAQHRRHQEQGLVRQDVGFPVRAMAIADGRFDHANPDEFFQRLCRHGLGPVAMPAEGRFDGVNVNGDLVSYAGEDHKAGVYIAPNPLTHEQYYFEVDLLEYLQGSNLEIGLVFSDYPLDKAPGRAHLSVAFNVGNGKIFKGNNQGRPFGSKCDMGDRIGCGMRWNQEKREGGIVKHTASVFFTRNYKEIGRVLVHVPPGSLHPAVWLHTEGQEVSVKLEAEWVHEDVIHMSIDNCEEEWSRLHDVQLNGQFLEYTGRGKGIRDVGLAQARFPLDPTYHYFEIEIVDPGEHCYIAIGLARRDYPKHRHPGWNKGSIAYHADDGKIFIGSGVGDLFGPTCQRGDLMGCGIMFPRDYIWDEESMEMSQECEAQGGEEVNDDYIEDFNSSDSEDDAWSAQPGQDQGPKVKIFFTRNGKVIGQRETYIPNGGFYPTVGMLSSDEKVRVDLRPLTG